MKKQTKYIIAGIASTALVGVPVLYTKFGVDPNIQNQMISFAIGMVTSLVAVKAMAPKVRVERKEEPPKQEEQNNG